MGQSLSTNPKYKTLFFPLHAPLHANRGTLPCLCHPVRWHPEIMGNETLGGLHSQSTPSRSTQLGWSCMVQIYVGGPGGITKANAHLLLLGLCSYHAWSWRSSQPAERHIKERGEESGESKVTRKIWGEEPHKKQMALTVVRTAAQSRL